MLILFEFPYSCRFQYPVGIASTIPTPQASNSSTQSSSSSRHHHHRRGANASKRKHSDAGAAMRRRDATSGTKRMDADVVSTHEDAGVGVRRRDATSGTKRRDADAVSTRRDFASGTKRSDADAVLAREDASVGVTRRDAGARSDAAESVPSKRKHSDIHVGVRRRDAGTVPTRQVAAESVATRGDAGGSVESKQKDSDAAVVPEPRPAKKRRKNCAYSRAQALSEQFFSKKSGKGASKTPVAQKKASSTSSSSSTRKPQQSARTKQHSHLASTPTASPRSHAEVANILSQRSTAAATSPKDDSGRRRSLKKPAGRLRVGGARMRRDSDGSAPQAQGAVTPHSNNAGFAFPKSTHSHAHVSHTHSSGTGAPQRGSLDVHNEESQPFVRELLGLPPRKLSPARTERLRYHQDLPPAISRSSGAQTTKTRPASSSTGHAPLPANTPSPSTPTTSSGGQQVHHLGGAASLDKKRRRPQEVSVDLGNPSAQKRVKTADDTLVGNQSATQLSRRNPGRPSPPCPKPRRRETFDEMLADGIHGQPSASGTTVSGGKHGRTRNAVADEVNTRRGRNNINANPREGDSPARRNRDLGAPVGSHVSLKGHPHARHAHGQHGHTRSGRAAPAPARSTRDEHPNPNRGRDRDTRRREPGTRVDSRSCLPTTGQRKGATKVCMHFSQNRCKFGSRCSKLHFVSRADGRWICACVFFVYDNIDFYKSMHSSKITVLTFYI